MQYSYYLIGNLVLVPFYYLAYLISYFFVFVAVIYWGDGMAASIIAIVINFLVILIPNFMLFFTFRKKRLPHNTLLFSIMSLVLFACFAIPIIYEVISR
ncbi:hypothetical protein [Bacillus alkalicellulosilyticus]|uniref:hypothetical protein n=1 Tax=Alkalihalobacterium alkalicellulosilyticum TaxID=1912214 RepID=UPI0009981641|nr:hypothetical protein [Bacillus alkalicellulosilyticus]